MAIYKVYDLQQWKISLENKGNIKWTLAFHIGLIGMLECRSPNNFQIFANVM